MGIISESWLTLTTDREMPDYGQGSSWSRSRENKGFLEIKGRNA
jgi:hypothetical protein